MLVFELSHHFFFLVLDVMVIGTALDIVYLDSDGLSLTVNSQVSSYA